MGDPATQRRSQVQVHHEGTKDTKKGLRTCFLTFVSFVPSW
jgi:hypothetical protein